MSQEISNDRHGWVIRYVPERAFAIVADHENGHEYLVNVDNIPTDSIGRRYANVNENVSFSPLPERSLKGSYKARITKFLDRPTDEQVDPEYYEDVQLRAWSGAYGFAIRPFGGSIFVHRNFFITEGVEDLQVGSWVRVNKFVPPPDPHSTWAGANIQVLVFDELPDTALSAAFKKAELEPQSTTEPPAVEIES